MEKPRFSISKPSRRVFIAASAMLEPVTPLISVESAIEVCARPPLRRPVSTVARRKRFVVMPALFIRLPARMKSGTASSAKFCVSVMVSWIGMVEGSSGCWRKNTQPEMPMANATGMPISNSTVNATSTQIIRGRPGFGFSRGSLPWNSSLIFSSVVIEKQKARQRPRSPSPTSS